MTTEYEEGWSQEQQDAALSQGWGIFHCPDSENGEWQLCKLDEAEMWPYDIMVWQHIWHTASRNEDYPGQALCAAALKYIERNNPKEWQSICEWCN